MSAMSCPSLPGVRRRTPQALVKKSAPARLEAIDMLRGLAMVVMALDHVRDYFSNAQFSPTDVAATTPGLFFTRWLTHFCAPVFVFLAGSAVALSARGGKPKGEQARFLFTRGVWLIVLELTLLRFAMTFSLDYHWINLTVLWAIGWSMIALAGLVHLRPAVVGALGVSIIAAHNLADGFELNAPAWARALLLVLHGPPATLHLGPNLTVHVLYPLVPWIGVMAAGYAFGSVAALDRALRRRVCVRLGAALTVAFVVLRVLNVYGDPCPWSWRASPLRTLMSFLNCEKYPPSLLFLLMTLGPALTVLGIVDRDRTPGWLAARLSTLGRVPMFYFLLHWAAAHALALLAALAARQPIGWLLRVPSLDTPPGCGFSLPVVYAAWLVVVLGVYPACRSFARLKQRRKDLRWLSYF